MDKKEKEILNRLSEDEYISAETLADVLSLSSKTIRNTIKSLDSVLHEYGVQIVSKYGKGYKLDVFDRKKYQTLSQEDATSEDENLNKAIIEHLLSKEDFVSTEEISDKLFVSRQTVFLRLKKMENYLTNQGIFLISIPGYGMRIEGSETDKRHCLVNNIYRFDEESIWKIKKSLSLLSDNDQYHISDNSFEELIRHIYVMINRIKNDIVISESEFSQAIEIEDFVQELAKQLCIVLETQFDLKIPKPEMKYLAIKLSGKQFGGDDSNQTIDEETMDLANSMIRSIKESFNLDLSSDFNLLISLCNHLTMLKHRLRLNVANKNPLLDDIKKNFPLAYSMAQQVNTVLCGRFHKTISEDEAGYIALIFELALEKKKFDISKKAILLVCSTGKSSSQLLKHKYATTFKDYIRLIHVTSLQDIGMFNVEKYDYIFTTVNIDSPMSVPVIRVGNFLEEDEIDELKKKLDGSKISDIEKYFDRELFFKEIDAEDKEDALRKICSLVKAKKNIPEDLFELVIERENSANTSYGNLVALPHPSKIVCSHTTVSVSILKNPVNWGGNEVQIVFLVLIGNQEGYYLRYFYELLSALVFDRQAVKKIVNHRDYDELIKILIKKENSAKEDR